MQVQCDICHGPTQPKEFKYKDPNRGTFTKYVCQGNCMDGRFKHSCFAPKVPNTTTPSNGPKPSGDAVAVLKSIDATLKNILTIMQQKSGIIPVQASELQPDEDVPF